MPAKRPTEVKVGNHTFGIHWGEVRDEEGSWLYGRTLRRDTRIEISSSVAPSQARDTLLHEVMHACLTDSAYSFESEVEESAVRALAPTLLLALRENPQLVRFLLEKANG